MREEYNVLHKPYYIDISHHSLNKKNEELCGDKVEIFKSEERTIIVLADGLGSGVKANILATLTSKITITMLKKGADIEEVIHTIINTLPVCKVRKIAYSTLSIIEINRQLECRIFESENPPFFFIRNGSILRPEKERLNILDKEVLLSKIQLQEDDIIYLCSDGVIHAGVGQMLNFGWEWKHVAKYLEKNQKLNAEKLNKRLLSACNDLYENEPGDDTTVVTIKVRKPLQVFLFTGPPVDKNLDGPFVEKFIEAEGRKVICGGTAANIVSRVLDRPIKSNLHYSDKNLPPTAYIQGIDLVTEGVLTIKRTIDLIKQYRQGLEEIDTTKTDGATQLFKVTVEDSTHIDFWIGKAVNQAHQTPDFPRELSMKINLVKELVELLKAIGKEVKLHYISEGMYEGKKERWCQ